MTRGDEQFYAWLDGELSDEEAAAVEARVAADARLSRLAEEDRALKSRLSRAFGSIADAPAPDRLLDALHGSGQGAEIVDFGAKKEAREASRIRPPQWMGLAASLAVGVLIGSTALNQASDAPVAERGGKLYAAAELETGLNTQLASAPADGPVRIGVTYVDRSGAVCRAFSTQGSSGLACRDRDRWQVRAMLSSTEARVDNYRMASSIDPILADMITSSMTGQPFDAAQEKAAMQRGWIAEGL